MYYIDIDPFIDAKQPLPRFHRVLNQQVLRKLRGIHQGQVPQPLREGMHYEVSEQRSRVLYRNEKRL